MRRAWLCWAALALVSCDPDSKCDPGQRYELGACFAAPRDAGKRDAGERDASEVDMDDAGAVARPDAAADSCQPGPGNYQGFGISCKKDSDCTSCVAPLCATAPINLCTHAKCDKDPDMCPPGWACVDVSMYSSNPDVTHLCLKL